MGIFIQTAEMGTNPTGGADRFGWVSGSFKNLAAGANVQVFFDLGPACTRGYRRERSQSFSALQASGIRKSVVIAMRALLLLFLSLQASAAITTTPGPWDLYRGASKVSSHQTEAACAAAADALGVARTYTCRTRTTVKVTADAPTPPTPPTVTWTECARETQLCVFAGRREVRYFGKQAGQQLITKVAEGQVQCDDSAFGAGPTTYENFCAFSSATTTAPVTVNQAPAPGPAPNPTPPPTGTAAGPRVATFTASGPITASSGQVISGLRISNPNGACITIPPGSANVTVRDSDIGPCAGDASILVQGAGAVIAGWNTNIFSSDCSLLPQ